MTKQCGNCKWWDTENASHGIYHKTRISKCLIPLPECVLETNEMFEDEGQDCAAFEEGINE